MATQDTTNGAKTSETPSVKTALIFILKNNNKKKINFVADEII